MLDQYFRAIKSGTPLRSINIFINLDDFFHKLHSPLINREFQIIGQRGPKQMVSNILNLMGHYRHYAKSRLHCDVVNVYGVYTTYLRTFKNAMYLPEYRKKYKQENDEASENHYYINQILKESYGMMRGISEYIPGIYLIDSEYIEPSVIPHYLAEKRKCDWNILITRDIYDLQYAALRRWIVISPKGENSSIISGSNMWDYIAKKERIKTEGHHYPTFMLPSLMTIAGDTYRSIPRLRRLGWKSLYRMMDTLVEEYKDSSDMVKQEILEQVLRDRKRISADEYNSNMASIDIIRQTNMMMDMDKLAIDSQLVDRYDYNALHAANHQIFIQDPLRIDFLAN